MERVPIKIGTKITVLVDGGKLFVLTIGAPNKGDPGLGLISCDAPLAKAVIGKTSGEVVSYEAAGQMHTVRIKNIC